MRAKSHIEMLAYEAKRRPEIADLLARVHDLTDEELANAKVPLPWYRLALQKIRDQGRADKIAANLYTHVMMHIEDRHLADPEGYQCRYNGMTQFVEIDRGNQLQIDTGTLIFFPKNGGVWIDNLFSKKIDHRLKTECIFEKENTLMFYKMARSDQRRNDHPGLVPSTVVDGVQAAPSQTTLWGGAVRIGPVPNRG